MATDQKSNQVLILYRNHLGVQNEGRARMFTPGGFDSVPECCLKPSSLDIPLEIPIGPWGSWFYRYRIRLPAPMSHRSTTEYEPLGKIKKNGQYRIWAPKIEFDGLFWGGEGGGGGGCKFRAVPNQANQQHVQNGALRLLGGSSFPKNDQSQPCTTYSVQVSLLHMFSWGPESITCFFFKNKIFLRVGLCFYRFGSLISWKLYRIWTIMNHHNHQHDYRNIFSPLIF